MADQLESPLKLSLGDLRENYTRGDLEESDVHPNPIAQFESWFGEARRSGLREPNAMTLSTATKDGRPSARIVLLKEVSENGFVFYSNLESRKGRDLAENPLAALTFYWPQLERQVRIEGPVEQLSRDSSEAYFATRPKGHRLGAWISRQSTVIQSRTILEAGLGDLEARYRDTDSVPMPEFWGGYRLFPESIEFWQGRPNRLHDRLRYFRTHDETWRLERLSP